MPSWQRRARILAGSVALVFAAVLWFAIRGDRRQTASTASVRRADRTAVVESTGAVLIQLTDARQSFRVEAARQLTYANGATRLADVKVIVDHRDGRSFTVTGREAEVGENQATVTVTGDVRLAVSDGLTARTDQVSHRVEDGIVRAPGPVSFERGRLSGSGVGMTYDTRQDVLWLLDQAVMKVAPDETGAGGSDIVAGAVTIARRDKYVRFERKVQMRREGQTIEADAATAVLSADEQQVEAVELRGNARLLREAGAAGTLHGMRARDMDLLYTQDGVALERARLEGDAAIEFAGANGVSGRRIAGQLIDIGFSSDGATVTAVTGRDRVQLDLPADRDGSARTIRAAAMDGSGEPDRGLTTATFTGAVEYRESRASSGDTLDPARASSDARHVWARRLDLTLAPGHGGLKEAHFSGEVRVRDLELDATAPRARYLVERGVVELVRGDEAASPAPRVTEDRTTIEAAEIALTLAGHVLTARHDVRSVLHPARGSKANAGGRSESDQTATKLPGMLDQDQPVNVTGDHLVYEGSAGRAVYSGHSRLWQGATAVQGDTIALDKRTGNLTAKGAVRSTLVLEHTDVSGKAPERTDRVVTVARARELHYEEAQRRATYTTDAHVSGPQGDLSADRIELYLTETGEALERAEAYGKVSLRSQGRLATGERLTYFAADERYVMSGAPVRILEECRESTGATLTFFKSTDTIVVDGKQETRTQTKSGGACPERRLL